ncbi:MAG: hypothetical protein K6E73_10605 [Bacteroidales bacterium]|nr:hypothetical protein [Bacteroidales bacterium]
MKTKVTPKDYHEPPVPPRYKVGDDVCWRGFLTRHHIVHVEPKGDSYQYTLENGIRCAEEHIEPWKGARP